jgi:hypothetical protein
LLRAREFLRGFEVMPQGIAAAPARRVALVA